MAKKKSNHIKLVFTQLIKDIVEREGNKPLNYKQISAKLNLHDEESRQIIREVLEDESFKGTFKEVEKGKFQLRELKTFLTV